MPASIAHMLISRKTREMLRQAGDMNDFVRDVLEEHRAYMELGALGPDLPYYESPVRAGWNTFVHRTDKPLGVDPWSYQLHSKDPNVFPLKMIEVTWKETDLNIVEWEPEDRKKFAFLCGFLTHVAADQIIHPIVNSIAGSYYKRLKARDIHRDCEVHQDLYALAKQRSDQSAERLFSSTDFGSWCAERSPIAWATDAIWFHYFIQKAFVEAHAVTPSAKVVARWMKGTFRTLHWCIHLSFWGKWRGPYGSAWYDLFDEKGQLRLESEAYRKFIALEELKLGKTYDDFFDEAVNLATVYVRAAYEVYCSSELDQDLRKRFRSIVQNADLGAPLEMDILADASAALRKWREERKAEPLGQ